MNLEGAGIGEAGLAAARRRFQLRVTRRTFSVVRQVGLGQDFRVRVLRAGLAPRARAEILPVAP